MTFRERRPIHPGEILAEDILPEQGMNANQVGESLGVPANRISEILRGRRSITADTALRLGRWLGSSPQFWRNLQRSHDLEVAEMKQGAEIEQQVTPWRSRSAHSTFVMWVLSLLNVTTICRGGPRVRP